jgi:hypothetical protein
MCLFSRQNTCAPVDAEACGSSESPTLRTRSKVFGRSSEGLQRPPQTRSKAFGPHQPAAYFHGTAGINRAGAIIRARGLGVLGGVLLSKTTKSLYIRFFLFFHFLYDFSKSIGTTHPNNLNRKNRVGKLLTCFCFYKTASGCQLTPQPSKVRNRTGVCSNRDKAIHS